MIISLITDAYSHKIVGYHLAETLETIETIKALQMALEQLPETLSEPLIHHSDRGVQYCSDEYQYLLSKYKIRCSMTQESDPYENAVAERINGILKQEFMIDNYHLELALMKKVVSESIKIYNEHRPHLSNHMLTPNKMHLQNKIKMKTYKTKSSNNPLITTA